jgi:serine/threonine protein kinase
MMADQTKLDTAIGTTIDSSASGNPTKLDISHPSPRVSIGGLNLPSALSTTYRMIEAITTQGAEADLFVIQQIENQKNYVLKLYRRGLKPKSEVIDLLRSCDRTHVVDIIDWGTSDDLWYEILEFCEHGTLRDLFKGTPVSEQLMLEILRELSAGIAYLHSKNIVHRDLKPENILIRQLVPLDLVLADFGIASLSTLTQHFTTRSRTVKYGAPESAAGAIGNASDYWSLGLMLLEGLSGHHPFDGFSDMVIALNLATKSIDVDSVTDARWKSLCKGLLIREPKKRWGDNEVRRWLSGDMPDLPTEAFDRPSLRPYKVAGKECWSASELAVEFARNWSEGEKHIARNLVLPWLRDELRDQDLANFLIDISEDKSLNVEGRLVRLIANMARGLPPVWRDISIDQATLVALCQAALEDNSEKAEIIEVLFEENVFAVWAQVGNTDCDLWARNWKTAKSDFIDAFVNISKAGKIGAKPPSKSAYLPALLLLVLSTEYLNTTRLNISSFAKEASRCYWLTRYLDSDSIGVALAISSFKNQATAFGSQEITAAKQLDVALTKLDTDYAEVLATNETLRNEIASQRQAILNNRAAEVFSKKTPDLIQRLFSASSSLFATRVFKKVNKYSFIELFFDGILFSCLFILFRFLLGLVFLGDGFIPLSAVVNTLKNSESYLSASFVCFLNALGGACLSMQLISRKLKKLFFGNVSASPKNP